MKIFSDLGGKSRSTNVADIRNVFIRLHDLKFTHAVNVRGRFSDVCRIAKCYNITICDSKMTQNFIL